jgi:hypothetical protein
VIHVQLFPINERLSKMVFSSAAHKDNADGVPHFMGLTGRTLSILVSIVATNGFLLFGEQCNA